MAGWWGSGLETLRVRARREQIRYVRLTNTQMQLYNRDMLHTLTDVGLEVGLGVGIWVGKLVG